MTSARGRLRDTVYNAIHRVAAQHAVLRLDGEANLFCDAPAEPTAFIQWVHQSRRGLLAYAIEHGSSSIEDTSRDALSVFDEQASPVVSTQAVFDVLAADAEHDGYLTCLLQRELLVHGGIFGDEEARAFAAAYFRQHGVPATPMDVAAYRAGVDGLFLSFVSAVGSQHDVASDGAVLLAPVGIDRALLDAAVGYGCVTDVVEELTGPVLAEWLGRDGDGARAVVLPVVNPLTGQVLTQRRARDLAGVVLRHNRDHPDRPVFVFSDVSGIESCHTEVIEFDTVPMGALTGVDVGDSSLGGMSAWTLDVVSPRMVLLTSRVAFAVTGNRWLRGAVNDWSITYGHANTCALDDLAAAAALCLTPRRWFDEANDHTANNLRLLREAVVRFNSAECGFEGLSIGSHVDGGWHTTVRFHQRLFPFSVDGSFDVFTSLLEYHCVVSDSMRVVLLPGELFSWYYDPDAVEPHVVLRVNLSAPREAFQAFLWQLGQCSSELWQRTWNACQRSARVMAVGG